MKHPAVSICTHCDFPMGMSAQSVDMTSIGQSVECCMSVRSAVTRLL